MPFSLIAHRYSVKQRWEDHMTRSRDRGNRQQATDNHISSYGRPNRAALHNHHHYCEILIQEHLNQEQIVRRDQGVPMMRIDQVRWQRNWSSLWGFQNYNHQRPADQAEPGRSRA